MTPSAQPRTLRISYCFGSTVLLLLFACTRLPSCPLSALRPVTYTPSDAHHKRDRDRAVASVASWSPIRAGHRHRTASQPRRPYLHDLQHLHALLQVPEVAGTPTVVLRRARACNAAAPQTLSSRRRAGTTGALTDSVEKRVPRFHPLPMAPP